MPKLECNCVFFIKNEIPNTVWDNHYNTCCLRLEERRKNGEFAEMPRDSDGRLKLQNPYLKNMMKDFLYHLALDTESHDLKKLFGDVKFICMGGTAHRMEQLAKKAVQELGIGAPSGCDFVDLSIASQRYCLYKVGPIISVNHGIGMSTLSVVLQELIKLLHYSGSRDPIIIRVGTCGGINVEPGTVVVSDKGYDGMLEETYSLPVLGKMVSWPAILDKRLAQEMASMGKETDEYSTVLGGTMSSNDFYNGQGRTDGAFCDYTESDKMEFLDKLKHKGIKNIEMEVTCFAALTHRAGIKAVDVCVTLLDRLNGDQVSTPKSVMLEWQERPMEIVFRYMQSYLKSIGRFPYGQV